MPYTHTALSIKFMSLSYIFSCGFPQQTSKIDSIVLISQVITLLLGDAMDHTAIMLPPTPSSAPAVLVHHTLHRKLWAARKAPYLAVILINKKSSSYLLSINNAPSTSRAVLHQPHEAGRLHH